MPIKSRLETRGCRLKRFKIMIGQTYCHVVKSCHRIGLVEYYILFAVVCVECVAGSDTIIASEDYLGVRKKGNLPCNAEDNLHPRLLVIEARFRGY